MNNCWAVIALVLFSPTGLGNAQYGEKYRCERKYTAILKREERESGILAQWCDT